MEFIPGTHTSDQIPHRDTFSRNNLLTRGQEVAVSVDTTKARVIDLRSSETPLHRRSLVHGSPPNPSNDRRIGLAIRYIPTDVRQVEGEDSATLVRGVDRHGHFEAEPAGRWPTWIRNSSRCTSASPSAARRSFTAEPLA